mmetsp:Transcript_34936/g.48449  ORF Transcript_34936/g.48449 Transcript_34936/m.48449 type:complete len:350 (-) Transcript_34936:245-1294(-)|eukprot:CAMPEP_0196580974 /NCGR_PEP_ID=MMETSP1081-20130531/31795_1 /TAXON_ID=36882 /ORGANISM="Pyramimonas amylifera, Strain CCMP720" /LENGTH=349 /DNA_ID=CAMNT_0041901037 /DNA_START=87 /DNA_END=1136 /DNA_ORIENTATION=-
MMLAGFTSEAACLSSVRCAFYSKSFGRVTGKSSAGAPIKYSATSQLGVSRHVRRRERGGRLLTRSMFEDQEIKDTKPSEVPDLVAEVTPDAELPSGVLFQAFSGANIVRVVQIPEDAEVGLAGARILLLDHTNNIHSIYKPGGDVLWGAYWDVLAAFPPLLPAEGVLGWYGLGAGTAPRAVKHHWPDREMRGWELDSQVVAAARAHMGLDDLEAALPPLKVFESDIFDADAVVEGGFAGLVVDLFAFGKLLPELKEATTWRGFQSRLATGGRIMINLGGGEDPSLEAEALETLKAIREVFQPVYLKTMEGMSANQIAIAGGEPIDFASWKANLPEKMGPSSLDWVHFDN